MAPHLRITIGTVAMSNAQWSARPLWFDRTMSATRAILAVRRLARALEGDPELLWNGLRAAVWLG